MNPGNTFSSLLLTALLTGCYTPGLPHQSGRHVELTASAPASIPSPVNTVPVLPKPQPGPRVETFSVVVNNLPVADLLFALARDAKINLDIHPGVEGKVTLNAINQTLPQILERIGKQTDIRWNLDGNTLSIGPDVPFLKIYRIDYFGLNKKISSEVSIANNVGSRNTGTTGNHSATVMQTEGENRFWPQLEAGLCKQVVSYKETRSEIQRLLALEKQNQKEREAEEKKKLKEQEYLADLKEAAARKGLTVTELLWEKNRDSQKAMLETAKALAPVAQGGTNSGLRLQAIPTGKDSQSTEDAGEKQKAAEIKDLNVTSCGFGTDAGTGSSGSGNAVSINPATGVVVVNGPQKLHRIVAAYLADVQASAQRQVLIEATVVEVTLSDRYQAGVNWAGLSWSSAGSWSASQSLTGSNIDPTGPISQVSMNSGGFSATLTFLEQFGRAKVLSSPKVMALNNQTAVMKVVDEQVYFGLKIEEDKNDSGVVTGRTYTSTQYTVPVGLMMQVTPQIAESGTITLNVRPTISRIRDYVEDPAVAIVSAQSNLGVKSLVPNLQVREFDSTLKIPSGQVAVLGGLIQDIQSNDRNGIPGLSRLPLVGDLFSYRDDTVKKIELVIFLRPVVVKEGGLEGELSAYQQFAPGKDFFSRAQDHELSAFSSGNLPPLNKGVLDGRGGQQ